MKNKKGLIFVLLAMLSASVFAAGADSYVVKSVRGNVTYETAPGKTDKVVVDQELSLSTIVKTNLNSALVLVAKDSDAEITIPAGKNGTVESLVKQYSVVAKGGLKNNSAKASNNIANASNGVETTVNTASSRASEAKQDYSWDDED
ncbi:MAG: hypothetical protein MJ162_03215 [Treponema sp.]|nr:hypothetical protein [Treponema sp.]